MVKINKQPSFSFVHESKRTIDEAGRLIVRANDNSRIAITAGDVHFGTTASVRS